MPFAIDATGAWTIESPERASSSGLSRELRGSATCASSRTRSTCRGSCAALAADMARRADAAREHLHEVISPGRTSSPSRSCSSAGRSASGRRRRRGRGGASQRRHRTSVRDREEAAVLLVLDGVRRDRLPEARPAGAGVELRLGGEEGQVAAHAGVGALRVVVPVRAREGALGALLARDVELLGREDLLPLVFGLDDPVVGGGGVAWTEPFSAGSFRGVSAGATRKAPAPARTGRDRARKSRRRVMSTHLEMRFWGRIIPSRARAAASRRSSRAMPMRSAWVRKLRMHMRIAKSSPRSVPVRRTLWRAFTRAMSSRFRRFVSSRDAPGGARRNAKSESCGSATIVMPGIARTASAASRARSSFSSSARPEGREAAELDGEPDGEARGSCARARARSRRSRRSPGRPACRACSGPGRCASGGARRDPSRGGTPSRTA